MDFCYDKLHRMLAALEEIDKKLPLPEIKLEGTVL